MSDRWRSVTGVALVAIILVVAGGLAPELAAAGTGPGDIISTVNLKQADGVTDLCAPINISGIGNNITGTSLAIVQGSKLPPPAPPQLVQYQALLVTSCLGASSDTTRKSTIYFVPSSGTSAGVKVHSIPTTFVPPRGWSALALRPDKGDFIGCVATGSNTGNLEIYKISYTGNAAVLVNSAIGALKGPVCDGLAWDYDTKTIYASKDGGTTVRRWVSASNNDSFTQITGDLTSPTQVPLGGGSAQTCLNSGLAMIDGALFVACQALSSGGALASTGHLLNKTTGAPLSAFGTVTGPLFDQTITADIECDPVTFGRSVPYRDALWAKNRNTNALNAFALPAYTCGRSIGPSNPIVTLVPPSFNGPGACPSWYIPPAGTTVDTDTDGDGLLDCWEVGWPADGLPGIDWDGDGVRDVVLCVDGVLPANCADKNKKDVFVEADSMQNHPFNATARQQVIDAFAAAPVDLILPAPPTYKGVNLHVLLDDGNAAGSDMIAHNDFVALEPCTPPAGTTFGKPDANFDQLKKNFFGTHAERNPTVPSQQGGKIVFAKRMAFRWALFAHDLKPPAVNLGARSSGCAKIGGDDLVVTLGSIYAGTLIEEPATTLTPGATSGTGVTFSAGVTNIFMPTDVGQILRGDAEKGIAGKATIVQFVSAQQVKADITQSFANTTAIPAGSWQIVVPNPEPPAIVSGNVNDQAGTFMHELGHTLGLRHGGFDNVNCKPNYLSVMSYSRQFSDGAPLTARRLDYSRGAASPVLGDPLPTLVEGAQSNADGIGIPALPANVTSDQTVFAKDGQAGRVTVIQTVSGTSLTPIDWGSPTDNDVNDFDFADSKISGCDTSPGETLVSDNDWSILQYNHRASMDVASGASNEVRDPVDGLPDAFQNVDVNDDGLSDTRCPITGQLWVINIQSPIKLSQSPGGDTQVKVFSQPGCIVAFLDPSTLNLAGSSGKPGAVKLKNGGQFNCSTPDLNNDGLPDLVCHFDDNGFLLSDVVGIVKGVIHDPTNPDPKGVGFYARGAVSVQ